ncbi:MAG: ribosomal protein S19 family protein [archaeon]
MIMKKKEFEYKGMNLKELQTLEVREFARYAPSRQRRTILRNFQKIEEFVNKSKIKLGKGKKIKIHQRDIVVVPEMVGMRISIYNGQTFIPVEIVGEMLGHKIGEFALTRSRVKHGSAGVGSTKGTKHKSKK